MYASKSGYHFPSRVWRLGYTVCTGLVSEPVSLYTIYILITYFTDGPLVTEKTSKYYISLEFQEM
jgi:hypothetical protein